MKNLLRLGALCLSALSIANAGQDAAPPHGVAKHVVLVVWDGMRPDFATQEYAPALYQLSKEGVFFQKNHSVFVTSTEVNGTALATGVYPNRSHIIANREYRPDIDPLKPVAMDSEDTIRSGGGDYIAVPTLEETLQAHGLHTAVAGTKAVALLPDRSPVRAAPAARDSAVIYAGKSNPPELIASATASLGAAFPPTISFPNADADAWTTRALTDFLWKDGVPAFSLLWMSDPDFSQHNTAPGSPIALAAIKSVDDNLAKVLAALDAKGVRADTDVIVVSDHGFSTVDKANDIAADLVKAGFSAAVKFDAPPKPGDIVVDGVGGSVLFYIVGHDADVGRKLVGYLQSTDYAGVVFTKEKMEGTFTLAQARLDSPAAPDVLVALRWSDTPNRYGVPGSIAGDGSRKAGQGMHATLSKFDVHNTLIAAGPDFKKAAVDDLPTGNVDVAPTILWILGVPPAQPLDGRVLSEAMSARAPAQPGPVENTVTQERGEGAARWRQYLKFTTLGRSIYLDEGNGGAPVK